VWGRCVAWFPGSHDTNDTADHEYESDQAEHIPQCGRFHPFHRLPAELDQLEQQDDRPHECAGCEGDQFKNAMTFHADGRQGEFHTAPEQEQLRIRQPEKQAFPHAGRLQLFLVGGEDRFEDQQEIDADTDEDGADQCADPGPIQSQMMQHERGELEGNPRVDQFRDRAPDRHAPTSVRAELDGVCKYRSVHDPCLERPDETGHRSNDEEDQCIHVRKLAARTR